MTLIVAEIKTRSPFGWQSPHTWDHLADMAITAGDWVSVHTDARWGGCIADITKVRNRTSKPILAKGLHRTDDQLVRALLAGATAALVVGRIPALDSLMRACWIEPTDLLLLEELPDYAKVVWNDRDLLTGGVRAVKTTKVRAMWPGWLCQASNIQNPSDVVAGVDAVLVGTHLPGFLATR